MCKAWLAARGSLKNQSDQSLTGEFELLVSHQEDAFRTAPFGAQLRGYLGWLALGITGIVGCIWIISMTSRSEELAQSLGVTRVVISPMLVVYPVLVAAVILTLCMVQKLCQIYLSARPRREAGSE